MSHPKKKEPLTESHRECS